MTLSLISATAQETERKKYDLYKACIKHRKKTCVHEAFIFISLSVNVGLFKMYNAGCLKQNARPY